MTDQERANYFLMRWWRDTEPDERTHDEEADLVALLAAVRKDERDRILAWFEEVRGSLADVLERLGKGEPAN